MGAVDAGGGGGPENWPAAPPGPLVLAPGDLHIWRGGLAVDDGELAALQDLLGPEERERAARLRAGPQGDAFVVARATLRLILARYVDATPAEIRLSAASGGKPELVGGTVRFNVAHSGDLAVYAVAGERHVGVDVERIGTRIDHLAVARRFFSTSEHRALAALDGPDGRQAFFACWTAKEAVLKAAGTGLAGGLRTVEVSVHADRPPALLRAPAVPGGAAGWSLHPLEVGAGYAAAVAMEGDAAQWRRFGVGGVNGRFVTANPEGERDEPATMGVAGGRGDPAGGLRWRG